jgi:hypothetical protein
MPILDLNDECSPAPPAKIARLFPAEKTAAKKCKNSAAIYPEKVRRNGGSQ